MVRGYNYCHTLSCRGLALAPTPTAFLGRRAGSGLRPNPVTCIIGDGSAFPAGCCRLCRKAGKGDPVWGWLHPLRRGGLAPNESCTRWAWADPQGWSCKARAEQPLADDPPRLCPGGGGEVLRILPIKSLFPTTRRGACFPHVFVFVDVFFVFFVFFRIFRISNYYARS